MSVRPDQIPEEVVEAAAMASYEAYKSHYTLAPRDDWEQLDASIRNVYRDNARAAFAAGIAAWPGMAINEAFVAVPLGFVEPTIVLPLETSE